MTGVMPMHMPMFSNVWNVKNAATPKHTSEPILLPERMPTMTQRMMTISNSTITGNYADNDLSGFDGDDTLYGGAGDDRLYGDSTLGGDDTLYGGEGQDVLIGGAGDDWLIDGSGSDVMVTGDGKDILFFAPESVATFEGDASVDRVTDFDTDGDKIDLKDFGYDDLGDLYDAGGSIVGSTSGTYIYFDGSGQGVLLEGVSVRTIDESDFLF